MKRKLIPLALFAFAAALAACSHSPSRNTASVYGDQEYTDLVLLNRNSDAYNAKRQLIQSVKPGGTLDMSYFIISDDMTASTFFLDVIKKIQTDKIKVRVVVDYFMSQKQLPFLYFLAANGIEVKRFRPPTDAWVTALQQQKIDTSSFIDGLMSSNKDEIIKSLAATPLPGAIAKIMTDHKSGKDKDLAQKLPSILYGAFVKNFGETSGIVQGLYEFMHRTHHKLLIADGKCFVMGGRNISDEYHTDPEAKLVTGPGRYTFNDTDIKGCESQGGSQEASFAAIWNSEFAFPANTHWFTPGQVEAKALTMEEVTKKASELPADIAGNTTLTHLRGGTQPQNASQPLPNLTGRLVDNSPPMTADKLSILDTYIERISQAKSKIDIVSAYFYIDRDFVGHPKLNQLYNTIVEAAKKPGMEINIYTNSIKSTDLNMVNLVAYTRYKELSAAGVHIYELGEGQGSLHTKSAAFDNDWLVVGSFNMDPRSHMVDSNNLIQLHDNAAGDATAAFRAHRIKAVHWDPINIDEDLKALQAQSKQLYFFKAVRNLL